MIRDCKIDLQYQGEIPGPPPHYGDPRVNSSQGDGVTVNTWKDTWIKNYRLAKERFGTFQDKSIYQLIGENKHKAAIVIGSGPSLKFSIEALRKNYNEPSKVLTISCLHNFGYFEDEGFHADYYLSLDSGGVVIDDVAETRNKDGGFYWEQTKGKKLIAYAASDPKLFDLWQGEIYLFNCLMPEQDLRDQLNGIERFTSYISSGGNALGGCVYIAKAVMGSATIIFVGADFCFDYANEFHSYKTHYDKLGTTQAWKDVFGNQRKTWPSYLSFKFFLDWLVCNVPGFWINCSEGILGAYPEGNIRQFKYMPLEQALIPFQMADKVFLRDMENKSDKLKPLPIQEFLKPDSAHDLVMY